jgi:hypothetical protein
MATTRTALALLPPSTFVVSARSELTPYSNCGNYIYAFVPQTDGTRKNTIAQVVDVCSSLDDTGGTLIVSAHLYAHRGVAVYFTLDGFKELGGKPKQSATIENVQ